MYNASMLQPASGKSPEIVRTRVESRHRIAKFISRSFRSLSRQRLYPPVDLPSVPLAFRIGVTGHLRVTDSDLLIARADHILVRIKQSLETVKSGYKEAVETVSPEIHLQLITSLAAGVDQIFARSALAQGVELQAVLPIPAADFAEDIRKNMVELTPGERSAAELAGSRAAGEFLDLWQHTARTLELSSPAGVPSDPDYLMAGRAILANSDILIAAVYPSAATGVSLNMIALALEHHVPVIWMPLDGGAVEILTLGTGESNEKRSPFDAGIEELIGSLTIGDMPGIQPGKGILTRWASWFEDGYLRTYNCEINLAEWERSWKPSGLAPQSDGLAESLRLIDQSFKPLAVWSDYRASAFSGLYRGAFTLNALLGVLAVLLALIGGLFHEVGLYAKCAELVLLALMSFVYVVAHRRNWRDRWVAYRSLYQETHHRAWRFLLGDTDLHHRDYDFATQTMEGSPRLRLAAVTRAAGVPMADASDAYLLDARRWIEMGFLDRQHTYFATEADKHHGLHGRYEDRIAKCVIWAFCLTSIAVAVACLTSARLTGAPLWHQLSSIASTGATIGGAWLPACAAALVAVAGFEEDAQFSSKYREMAAILDRIRGSIRALRPRDQVSAWSPLALTRQRVAALLNGALHAAEEELVQWRTVMAGKTIDRH